MNCKKFEKLSQTYRPVCQENSVTLRKEAVVLDQEQGKKSFTSVVFSTNKNSLE
jgi:hypothetical protein